MTTRSSSASGKIILSGEYAVVFGKKGIAIPSSMQINVHFSRSPKNEGMMIAWNKKNGDTASALYAKNVAEKIRTYLGSSGIFLIDGTLPIGKGMGASTALVIAMCRAAFGEKCGKEARAIEDAVSPGNSGIDFAVIWEEKPILFQKGSVPKVITLPANILSESRLIDTGAPTEPTPTLVAWVKQRHADNEPNIRDAIETIGQCTERILAGESLKTVMRDHHRAQVLLGVVPANAQAVIADIETAGGSGKVIGAGGRSGGGGMVLTLPA